MGNHLKLSKFVLARYILKTENFWSLCLGVNDFMGLCGAKIQVLDYQKTLAKFL